MEDRFLFTNPDAVSNIDTLAVKQSILTERRALEISELALEAANLSRRLFADGLGAYEVMSVISENIGFGSYPRHEDFLEESRLGISASLAYISELDKLLFCESFLREAKDLSQHLNEEAFLPSVEAEESFIYVRNAYSDEAYDVFSQNFSDPRVRYASSFRECAAAVASGECGYCLLPLEERGGARLHGVAELLYSYDLSICSVTPVFGPLGDADLKYCLVSRGFLHVETSEGDDRYLELRLTSEEGDSLSGLLNAAAYFGNSVYRVNSMSFASEEGQSSFYSLVLKNEKLDFTPLLTYLSIFARNFVPVGLYKNLE